MGGGIYFLAIFLVSPLKWKTLPVRSVNVKGEDIGQAVLRIFRWYTHARLFCLRMIINYSSVVLNLFSLMCNKKEQVAKIIENSLKYVVHGWNFDMYS